MRNLLPQKGFSIVEAILAIFILSTAIMGLFSVLTRATTTTIRTANENLAKSFAVEGLEVARQIRDANIVAGDEWSDGLVTPCSGDGCYVDYSSETGGLATLTACSGECPVITVANTGQYESGVAGTDTLFTRGIWVSEVDSDEILVQSFVWWNDRGFFRIVEQQERLLNWSEPEGGSFTLVASSVVCPNESDLPNWGQLNQSSVNLTIDENTASDFLASNPQCWADPGWYFQWGYDDIMDVIQGPSLQDGITVLSSNFIGQGDGSEGPGTDTGPDIDEWKTIGPTGASGTLSVPIPSDVFYDNIAFRAVLDPGYVPFSHDGTYGSGSSSPDNYSAEFYCHDDAYLYDNYDFVLDYQEGQTYYCVGFFAQSGHSIGDAACPQYCTYPSLPGRTIVDFGPEDIQSGSNGQSPFGTPQSVSIPAGTYKISLHSWDGTDRNVSWQLGQVNEQWGIYLKSNGAIVATSGVTEDLTDGVDTACWHGEVTNTTLTVNQSIDVIQAVHANQLGYPGTDSVETVCAVLDLIP